MSCWEIDQKPFLHIMSMWSWPLTHRSTKTHWGHLLIKNNSSVKIKGQWFIGCPVVNRNLFDIQRQSDLNLWPPDLKITKGHLLAKTNAHMQFEGNITMSFHVTNRKSILPTKPIWPWSLTHWPKNGPLLAKTNPPSKFGGPRADGLSS
jgi:hypothetical protein